MSVAQGGNGFPFLAKVVYEYISTGRYTDTKIDVDTISGGYLKFSIEKVEYSSIV